MLVEWELTPLLGDAPFTTIAARLWHLGARPCPRPKLRRDLVLRWQFGESFAPSVGENHDAFPTAAEAVRSIAGQYAESTYVGLMGHLTNEYVHHAAEVRLLRRLYKSGGAAIGGVGGGT